MRRQLDGPIDAETAISLVEGAPAQYSWNHFHAQVIHIASRVVKQL